LTAWLGVMGVCGRSLVEEATGGDLGGEPEADFGGFLKNLDTDLFGSRRCEGEDGEPL
jgi:hypothetical protein